MNRGNNKPSSKSRDIDDFVEWLNKILSRLLGKTAKSPKQRHESSNITFTLIILLSCIVLWLVTGFYYLNENEYGLISINGKVVKVTKGLKVGFTFPYPFGDVEIIDAAPSQVMGLGGNLQGSKSFTVLDKNLLPFSIEAKFSYQINEPLILYKNYLQHQDNFDNEVLWNVQSKIANTAANSDLSALKTTNFTVLSNQIHTALDLQLSTYGIKLSKFDITSIHAVSTANNLEGKTPILSNQKNLPDQLHGEAIHGFTREVKRDRTQGWAE